MPVASTGSVLFVLTMRFLFDHCNHPGNVTLERQEGHLISGDGGRFCAYALSVRLMTRKCRFREASKVI